MPNTLMPNTFRKPKDSFVYLVKPSGPSDLNESAVEGVDDQLAGEDSDNILTNTRRIFVLRK